MGEAAGEADSEGKGRGLGLNVLGEDGNLMYGVREGIWAAICN